jgi:hypothetical protein
MSTPDDMIQPIDWVAASSVLPNEAHDFTPWLARNLHLLADVLGLDELKPLGTEVRVGDYRLDILAEGQFGEEVWPVAIENQYQTTDHRHLGQLITYLAQQEHGHAVWVVEDASDQHLAAMEFLNRTTVAEFNYWLLRVRFTPSGSGYQVFFDVLSRPNEFVRHDRPSGGGIGETTSNRTVDERYDFHAALLERLRGPLSQKGWRNVAMHTGGWHVRMLYPRDVELARWGRVVIRSHTDNFYIHLLVVKGDQATNTAIVEELHRRYSDHLQELVPSGGEIRWHEAGQAADGIKVVFHGDGFTTDPDEAAEAIQQVCVGWLSILRDLPLDDIDELLEQATQ